MAVPELWRKHYKEIVWAFCKAYSGTYGVSLAAMYTALLVTAQGENADIRYDPRADIDEVFVRDSEIAKRILAITEDLTIHPHKISPFLTEAQRLVGRYVATAKAAAN